MNSLIAITGIIPSNVGFQGDDTGQRPAWWPAAQPIGISPYSAPAITVTMNPPLNISDVPGANLIFNIRMRTNTPDNGSVILQLNSPTVSDPVNGVFTFLPTSEQTGGIPPGDYYEYDVWITVDPQEVQIAYGSCYIKKQQWQSN